MNLLFALFITASCAFFAFKPELFLPAAVSGGQTAIFLCIKMAGLYAFWLGLFKILERSDLSSRLARLLKKPSTLLFGSVSDKAQELMLLNISANLLGVSNLATPLGIEAVREMKTDDRATFPMVMFFVLNATSLQVVPSTMLSLLSIHGATNPTSIIAPTILVSLSTTIIGIILVKVFVKR